MTEQTAHSVFLHACSKQGEDKTASTERRYKWDRPSSATPRAAVTATFLQIETSGEIGRGFCVLGATGRRVSEEVICRVRRRELVSPR